MYDELVKRLRSEADFPYNDNRNLLREAADAVEELSLMVDSCKRSMEEWAKEAYRAYSKYAKSIFDQPKEE